MKPHFADIVLPLALPKRSYCYSVPPDLAPLVRPGVRVEVSFGKNKLYSGLVISVHQNEPEFRVKPIIAVLDELSIVSPEQFQLWDWLAEYYCCTLGEVMAAAMPGHLKLTSETRLLRNERFGDDFSGLNADEYLIAEALHIQQEISIEDARKILNKRTVFPVIQQLLALGVLVLKEDLIEKYKPKKLLAVVLAEPYRSQAETLKQAFNQLEKSERQLETLMAFLQLQKTRPFVRRQEILDKAGVSEAPLQSLIKKGILALESREVSRIGPYEDESVEAGELSEAQSAALASIRAQFSEKNTVLLHGITGSGKTRIYMELIREVQAAGGQVLYLLPEIALTTHLLSRLQRVFGNDIAVYHSKINYHERVELWRSAAAGKPLIVSARSGLFLPFANLKLIIVDEEHDPSFKQYDPAPRYHARDAAIYLATLCQAKTLLGTATPAVESYHNAVTGKYGLVTVSERFGGAELPTLQTVDLRKQHAAKQMHGVFSGELIEALKAAHQRGEQAILFQNRRGYSPILQCQVCNWNAQCKHCDVSLTYYKHAETLRCHYCGYTEKPPALCPACGSGKVSLLGFGTEKIEEDLKLILPEVRIARMDLDTAGSKSSLTALLHDFEEKKIDILVGTQMVTKGLDFENVGVVGVIGADQLIRFPDFRAAERAFQLLTQVAGRAGRKKIAGHVYIQAFADKHPVMLDVLNGQYAAFFNRELAERQAFAYPPFSRLINLTVRHKKEQTADQAAAELGGMLRRRLGERVLGPVLPHVPKIRGYYARQMMLKLEKSATLISQTKQLIKDSIELLQAKKGFGQIIVGVDVDPM